jgi:hypothetical protein
MWRHEILLNVNGLTGTWRHFLKVAPDKLRKKQANQVTWRQSFYLALPLEFGALIFNMSFIDPILRFL